jgi:hypothetical protein
LVLRLAPTRVFGRRGTEEGISEYRKNEEPIVYIIISLVLPLTISRDLCRQFHILPWEGNEFLVDVGAKSVFLGVIFAKTSRERCNLTRKDVESLMEPLTQDQP